MSDIETPTKSKSSGGGWTDKERMTYLFALIDNSNVKFDYNRTPRPEGRTVVACQRMIERLRGTLKNELEALNNGEPIGNTTPKKKLNAINVGGAANSPRKRKNKADGNDNNDGNGGGPPKKRGRPKKMGSETPIKYEIDDEDGPGGFLDEI